MPFRLMCWSLTLLLFVSVGLAFERPAYAYTDPGSALLFFQSLGAVASGLIFYFRRGLKRLFVRERGAKAAAGTTVVSHVDSSFVHNQSNR